TPERRSIRPPSPIRVSRSAREEHAAIHRLLVSLREGPLAARRGSEPAGPQKTLPSMHRRPRELRKDRHSPRRATANAAPLATPSVLSPPRHASRRSTLMWTCAKTAPRGRRGGGAPV